MIYQSLFFVLKNLIKTNKNSIFGNKFREMKIIQKKIDELIEAEYNPRILSESQRQDLEESLLRFGMVDPVIINKNKERKNIIIGGHQRKKIWAELGNKTVPCVELDLTLEQERELNIRLNKNTGDFDIALLKSNFEDLELMEYGFEDFELGVFEEPDYSVLEDEEIENKSNDLKIGTKNTIEIEFTDKDFNKGKKILKELKKEGVDIGKMFIEKMKK